MTGMMDTEIPFHALCTEQKGVKFFSGDRVLDDWNRDNSPLHFFLFDDTHTRDIFGMATTLDSFWDNNKTQDNSTALLFNFKAER